MSRRGRRRKLGPALPSFIPTAAGQWASVVQDLYRKEPVFRGILDRFDELLRREGGESLIDEALGKSGALDSRSQLEWPNYANFAVQVALTALWESIGIRPVAAMGIGMGEIAAAQTAGALTMENGLRLAAVLTGEQAALPVLPVTAPVLPLISSVTGKRVQAPGELDNAHWRRLGRRGRRVSGWSAGPGRGGRKPGGRHGACGGFGERFWDGIGDRVRHGGRQGVGQGCGQGRRGYWEPDYPVLSCVAGWHSGRQRRIHQGGGGGLRRGGGGYIQGTICRRRASAGGDTPVPLPAPEFLGGTAAQKRVKEGYPGARKCAPEISPTDLQKGGAVKVDLATLAC